MSGVLPDADIVLWAEECEVVALGTNMQQTTPNDNPLDLVLQIIVLLSLVVDSLSAFWCSLSHTPVSL